MADDDLIQECIDYHRQRMTELREEAWRLGELASEHYRAAQRLARERAGKVD